MIQHTSRRGFLKSTGAAVTLAAFGGSLLSRPAHASMVGLRRNLGHLAASDPILVTYRNAIAAMKALPDTDPRSWTYQAAIHGCYLFLFDPPGVAFNTCQHTPRFFWAWHRMYLYWFERICSHMAGDAEPCWRLPYWDWSSPTQRQVPAPFRDPASELYGSRSTAMNDGTGSLTSGSVDLAGMYAAIDFMDASQVLSDGPHSAVHSQVNGWMAEVEHAAQDPLFFVHHANVDRLWNLWLAQGGRSDPLDDDEWKDHVFTFFDENGAEVTMTPCQILRAAEQLSYIYEGEPDQVRPNCETLFIPWKVFKALVKVFPYPPIWILEKPTSIDLALADVKSVLEGIRNSDDQSLMLKLEEVVADSRPENFWEVHLGGREGETLTDSSPSFLGVMASFGDGVRGHVHGEHKFVPASFTLPIHGPLLERVKASSNLRLTFIPRSNLVNGKPGPLGRGSASIGRVSLALATRTAQTEK